MKLKVFLLLFPVVLFGQDKNSNLSVIKNIESKIKFADSISNFTQEEIENFTVIPSHGRIDDKQIPSIQIQTRILRYSKQILRIRYSQSNSKESWRYYYVDSKLIYAESNILGAKKKNTKKRFYFNNDKLISPLYSDRNYDLETEVTIFIKAYEVFKSVIR